MNQSGWTCSHNLQSLWPTTQPCDKHKGTFVLMQVPEILCLAHPALSGVSQAWKHIRL
jgi:hypothetical protein